MKWMYTYLRAYLPLFAPGSNSPPNPLTSYIPSSSDSGSASFASCDAGTDGTVRREDQDIDASTRPDDEASRTGD